MTFLNKSLVFTLILGLGVYAPFASGAASDGGVSQSEMMPASVRDRVQALRQERMETMPYLDRSFIQSTIQPGLIEEREMFAAHPRKSLQDLISRAVEAYTPARAAHERISLAQRRILVAVRNLFPEASFDWEERDGDLSATPFNSMSWRVNLRQPIFRGGILWNTLLQEKAGLEASRKEYDAVLSDLIHDVSEAYFEFSRAIQVMEEQRSAVEKMKRFADISKQKFQAQIISEIEHLNVESLYSEMQYELETAKQEVEIAKLELQKFLNLGETNELSVEPLYDLEKLLKFSETMDEPAEAAGAGQESRGFGGQIQVPALVDLVDLAYQNRAELRVEAARLQAARLEERIRWGAMIPHADLVIETGKLGEAFDMNSVDPSLRKDLRIQLELNWNVAGNNFSYELENREQAPSVTQFQQGTGSQATSNRISVGLFDGLQDLVDTKQAEVEKLDQIVALEETEKEVVLDVKQSYYDYQKARIQVQSSAQRVNYRKRLADLARFRLEKNEIEVSEYVQAEMDLLRETAALHTALADYFTAKASLNHAIGKHNYFPLEEQYEP